MSTVDQNMIALIDQRTRAAQATVRAAGTLVTRDATGPGAQVVFDGSTVAMPVKVLGHVLVREGGARVVLDKYGPEWVVTGCFSAPQMGSANDFTFGATDSTSSATFDSLANTSFSFTKYWDLTWIQVSHTCGGFATVAATEARYALRLTQTSGDLPYTPVDYNGASIFWSAANDHQSNTVNFMIGSTVPAGTYTVAYRWRRVAGTGVVNADGNDIFSVIMREFVHPTAITL